MWAGAWARIGDACNTTARDVLGFAQKRPEKHWLSSETLELADERKRLKAYKRAIVRWQRSRTLQCLVIIGSLHFSVVYIM